MVRGIEAAAAGMVGITELNDVIANNLANINTPGFKQTLLAFKNIQELEVSKIDAAKGFQNREQSPGTISAGSAVDALVIDFKQGSIKQTGNPFDVAINGDGFFTIQTQDGVAYSRNGNFMRNNEGLLTTLDGNPVIGESGPIALDIENVKDNQIKIHSNGDIEVNKEIVDRIKIVDFEDKSKLSYQGNSLFKANGENLVMKEAKAQLSQGSLESANSTAIETMIKSIDGSRTYEMLSKTIETSNRSLGKIVNEVGRIKR